MGELPWMEILCVLTHTNAGRICTLTPCRGKLHILYFSGTRLYMLLVWLISLNLYPFPTINHDCEYNSVQWVPWVLANYRNWGCFEGTPSNLQLVLEVREVFTTVPSNFVGGPNSLQTLCTACSNEQWGPPADCFHFEEGTWGIVYLVLDRAFLGERQPLLAVWLLEICYLSES